MSEQKVVEHLAASISEGFDASASLEEAKEEGLYRHSSIRHAVKMGPSAPKIVIAVPIGDKDDPDMFQCPHCERRQVPTQVTCENCGEGFDGGFRLRAHGLVSIEWLLAMWQMVPPLLTSLSVMVRKGILSAQAREEMTIEAMRLGAKYIWYVDDDTLPPPKALYDMHNVMELNPHIGALSGVYTTREPLPEPLIYRAQGQGACWDFSVEPGVTEPIMGAGAGCLLARVECLKEVQDILGGPLWSDVHEYERGGGRQMWGHDIRFCRRIWEAGESGKASQSWEVHVAGWVQCYHFDIGDQVLYAMPRNAPCFQNANTPRYWDYVWSTEPHGRNYEDLYAAIAERVPEGSRVIDVGAGVGVLLAKLVEERKVLPLGIELSQKAVNLMQGRNIPAEQADAGEWTLTEPDAIVIATETMEHLDDKRLAHFVGEAAKAKRFIASVPQGELVGTPTGEHVQIFTEQSLKDLLSKHFAKVSITTIPRAHPPNSVILLADCERE